MLTGVGNSPVVPSSMKMNQVGGAGLVRGTNSLSGGMKIQKASTAGPHGKTGSTVNYTVPVKSAPGFSGIKTWIMC